MRNEDELTLKDCAAIVVKRKWLVTGIAAFITIASGVFLYTKPTIYTANLPAEISSSRIYYHDIFGDDFILNSLPPDRTMPIHIYLLKSKRVLERVAERLKEQNADCVLTPAKLSRKLTVKTIHSKTGKLILQAQDSKPKNTVQLVNAWAQEYQRYNEERSSFCLENISLTYNQIQLIKYDKKLKELGGLQDIDEKLLCDLESKMAKNQNQANLQAAVASVNIALNEIRIQISSFQDLRQKLLKEIERQKIKLAQLQTETESSLSGVTSFIEDNSAEEENIVYKHSLTVSDNSLTGVFAFSSLAEKAGSSLLSKQNVLMAIIPISLFFAILLVCLPEIYCS